MFQNYEIYLIQNPELNSEQINENISSLEKILDTEVKVQNLKVESEGLKKLAYPIKKHNTGFYSLVSFDIELGNSSGLKNVEKKLNLNEGIVRYLIINQTEFIAQQAKETRKDVEIVNHRELNKGKVDKKCISKHLGLRVINYKDVSFLNQFTSPYAKIFAKVKTGSSTKFQRKINQAIKRARHMALMPFTPKYNI